MKNWIFIFLVLSVAISCKKYVTDLNKGKNGCIDCILRIDTIKNSDTTHYNLQYEQWYLTTERTDWCNYLNRMKEKTTTINDTVVVKYRAICK